MKEARYLIRIGPNLVYEPEDHSDLLAQVRILIHTLPGKAINLRVTARAIEFDLFCDPETDLTSFLPQLKPLGEVMTCKRLDLPPGPVQPQQIVNEARQLFNEHRFWEVHEVLEGLWKVIQGNEKQLVQGLILCAAALVHAQKDELTVTWPMMADALRRLQGQPTVYYGWEIEKFRDHFTRVLAEKKLDFPTV